jgi:hydrogenase maturation protease
VAGIGNVFFGDDGFGVEVAQRLASRGVPAGARVCDFGIRSLDLAYALQDGYEAVVLVDAYPHGEAPGTLYVVEPDLRALGEEGATLDAHGMDPVKVLRMAASMGALPKRILLLGCEPATLGAEEGQVGLSEVVAKSIDEAAAMVEKLLQELLGDTGPGQGA